MDTARCREDGAIYTAANFSRLPQVALNQMRRFLECPECCGSAFFRHTSHNGRAPCFGARPHVDGCRLAAQDQVRLQNSAGDNLILPMPNHGGKIVVDFNYGAYFPLMHHDSMRADAIPRHQMQSYSHGTQPNCTIHRRLSSLLNHLLESTEFRTSDQLLEINIDGFGLFAARDLFVPLHSVTPQLKGQNKGFWGFLSDVQYDENNTLWFNSGGRDNISFCLDAKYFIEFRRKYHISDEEDIAGAYILVFGKLLVAQNGKLYCVIEDVSMMALRLT